MNEKFEKSGITTRETIEWLEAIEKRIEELKAEVDVLREERREE